MRQLSGETNLLSDPCIGADLAAKGHKRGRWQPPADAAKWSDLYSTCTGRVLDSVAAAQEAVGLVNPGDRMYVISRGNWSTEHVICHLGEQLGPVDLRIATWAVNDDAVLRLANAIEAGFIRSCHAIVDERMKVLRPAALDVMQKALGAGGLATMPCHMKAYALRQVEGGRTITMVGSANWTQNPRPECSVIDSDPRAFDLISGWVGWALSKEGPGRPYHHTGKLRDELITASGYGVREKMKADLAETGLAQFAERMKND